VNVQVSQSILDQEWREVSIVALAHFIIMASLWDGLTMSYFQVNFCSLMYLKQFLDLSHTHSITILARDSILPQYVELLLLPASLTAGVASIADDN